MNSQLNQQNLLSFILGNQSTIIQTNKQVNEQTGKINKKLIMSSAMFWDSKKRIEKIKTLFLTGIALQQFDDTQDFQVQQLSSIELLSLSKNSIIHLHPLSQLTALVSLNVSHNKVYDLNPLSSLVNLSELYASNNQIKSIQPIETLTNLKTLQVYKNKISIQHQQSTFKTLLALSCKLEELDIQENPICDENFCQLVQSTLLNLKKFNGNLNKTSQKIKQMSSSKGFNSSKAFKSTSSMMFNNTKMDQSFVVLGDAQSTLYNFSKKKDVNHSKIMEKQKILKKLQDHYTELDEQFEQQIIKNVKIKNKLHKLMESKSQKQSEKQQNEFQKEEIKNLKRKVKAMKQNLFTKDKKGELLRKIFEIQTTYIKPEPKKQNTLSSLENQSKIGNVWIRKFQADEVIIINNKNSTSKVSQQIEMNQTLNQFDSTLADLKNQLEYLS